MGAVGRKGLRREGCEETAPSRATEIPVLPQQYVLLPPAPRAGAGGKGHPARPPQQAEGPEAGRRLEHEGRGPLGTEGATNPQPMGGLTARQSD